jgi:hypothetical protein
MFGGVEKSLQIKKLCAISYEQLAKQQKSKWYLSNLFEFYILLKLLQDISKMQITFKDKAQADEKAQHTCEYVSILKRLATP